MHLHNLTRGRALAFVASALMIGAPVSAQSQLGVDTTHFDRSVRPQDDFYRFVNGSWLKSAHIPADKSSYGTFVMLNDKSDESIRTIVEDVSRKIGDKPSTPTQKIGDFYRTYMDTARIEKLGLTPLRPELDRISKVALKSQLPAQFAHLRRIGVSTPFSLSVNQDAKSADRYAVYIGQSGLGLPDRDYYLKQDAKFADTRVKYAGYVTKLLTLAGQPNPAEAAQHIVALETDLAQHQWDRVKSRDANARYNKMSVADLKKRAPDFDWSGYLQQAGATGVDTVIVSQPDYIDALDKTLAATPLEDLKTYMKYKLLASYSGLLSSDFVNTSFDFNGRVLQGLQEQRERAKRGVSAVEGALGELVGSMYVQRYFRPESKTRMEQLVHNLQEAFSVGIDSLEWMSPATKAAAHDKLAHFTVKIAYPDKWRDYSALEVRPGDAVGNAMRSNEFNYNRMINRLGKPVDRTEWGMTPQTVNAYYSSTMNEIVFPAAILQPPFFNPDADDAVNYGGIGAVIGHEMSHAFDDQGRKSDGTGNLRDWWTADDAKAFTERADRLAAQFDSYTPLENMHINGHLTLGENIGDLSGLAIAYRAYRMSLHGQPAPVIGGYTGDQRFFMGWAQVWANLDRDESLRQSLVTNPHSPDMYRGNGPLVNIQAFYDAWGVKPGDKMWVEPEKRIKIW